MWLNPVILFTLNDSGVIQPNGYGFSTYDQPGIDVYYVFVGELNGDFPMRSSTTTAFARAWASVLSYGPNDGPGLSAQDKQNILMTDRYASCTYQSPVGSSACPNPPDATYFTQSTNTSFPYQQPVPGVAPDSTSFSWTYTDTNTSGQSVSVEYTSSFGLENSIGGGFTTGIFALSFQQTLKQEWMSSTKYETSSEFKTSSTSSATASITGPACTVASGSCNPVYPPANAFNPVPCTALSLPAAFGQGTNMFIYQDNLFGTFLIAPFGQ